MNEDPRGFSMTTRCFLVAVTDAILARVRRPFPIEPVRMLDAVHLATTEFLGGSALPDRDKVDRVLVGRRRRASAASFARRAARDRHGSVAAGLRRRARAGRSVKTHG